MISTISHMLILLIPALAIADLVRMLIINSLLYIDDAADAWNVEEWKYLELLGEILGESISCFFVIASVIMACGTILALCGGTSSHETTHGIDFVGCGYWWISTVCYTIYIGITLSTLGIRGLLYHLRNIKRYQKVLGAK